MNDVVKLNEKNNQGSDLMTLITQASMSKDVDVDKLQALLNMNMIVHDKNAEIAFNEAMARLQPQIPEIKKDAKGHNSKYAKYESIDRLVRPLYTKEGFSVRFNSTITDAGELYEATLMHVKGHSVVAKMVLPPDKSAGKTDIQAKGSTISYAKRYLLCMLFNIVTTDEDTDGEKLIDESQVFHINELLNQSGADHARFLEFMKIDCVEMMSKKDFGKALNTLKQKIQKQGGSNGATSQG